MDREGFERTLHRLFVQGQDGPYDVEPTIFWLARLGDVKLREALAQMVSIQQDVFDSGSASNAQRYTVALFFLLLFFQEVGPAREAAGFLKSTLDVSLLGMRLSLMGRSIFTPPSRHRSRHPFFLSEEEYMTRLKVAFALCQEVPEPWLEVLHWFIGQDLHECIRWMVCEDVSQLIPEGFYSGILQVISAHVADAKNAKRSLPLVLVCTLCYNPAIARRLIQTGILLNLLSAIRILDPSRHIAEQFIAIARLEIPEFDTELQLKFLDCVVSQREKRLCFEQKGIVPDLQLVCYLNSGLRDLIKQRRLTANFPLVFPSLLQKLIRRCGMQDARKDSLRQTSECLRATTTCGANEDCVTWTKVLDALAKAPSDSWMPSVFLPDSALEQLCKITLEADGSTFMHIAMNESLLWISAALRFSPNLNAKNKRGRSPLELGCVLRIQTLILDDRVDIASLAENIVLAAQFITWEEGGDVLLPGLASRGVYQTPRDLRRVLDSANHCPHALFRFVYSLQLALPKSLDDLYGWCSHNDLIPCAFLMEMLLRAGYLVSFASARWLYAKQGSSVNTCPITMLPTELIHRLFSEFVTMFSVKPIWRRRIGDVNGQSRCFDYSWRWSSF